MVLSHRGERCSLSESNCLVLLSPISHPEDALRLFRIEREVLQRVFEKAKEIIESGHEEIRC